MPTRPAMPLTRAQARWSRRGNRAEARERRVVRDPAGPWNHPSAIVHEACAQSTHESRRAREGLVGFQLHLIGLLVVAVSFGDANREGRACFGAGDGTRRGALADGELLICVIVVWCR